MDLNHGSYGYDDMPELPRGPRGAQPRGAAFVIENQADLEPELNRKTDVWAYKVASFTEEAMSRQWDATTDVPWNDLDKYERTDEIEIAFAQLCTFFTEVELIATDLPAKWLWRMNNQFSEVKHFIATQAMDEARHAEVFRKRALAGGVGLMEALPQTEHSLKAILDGDTYSEASAFMHLLAEGNVLTMFRFSEFISPTPVDKRIFQLVMQDEARHVSYGMQHLKWIMDHAPEQKEQLHRALDEGENVTINQFDAALTECMIVLAGKGTKPEQIAEGVKIVGNMQAKQITEYFHRLERAGFARPHPALEVHADDGGPRDRAGREGGALGSGLVRPIRPGDEHDGRSSGRRSPSARSAAGRPGRRDRRRPLAAARALAPPRGARRAREDRRAARARRAGDAAAGHRGARVRADRGARREPRRLVPARHRGGALPAAGCLVVGRAAGRDGSRGAAAGADRPRPGRALFAASAAGGGLLWYMAVVVRACRAGVS